MAMFGTEGVHVHSVILCFLLLFQVRDIGVDGTCSLFTPDNTLTEKSDEILTRGKYEKNDNCRWNFPEIGSDELLYINLQHLFVDTGDAACGSVIGKLIMPDTTKYCKMPQTTCFIYTSGNITSNCENRLEQLTLSNCRNSSLESQTPSIRYENSETNVPTSGFDMTYQVIDCTDAVGFTTTTIASTALPTTTYSTTMTTKRSDTKSTTFIDIKQDSTQTTQEILKSTSEKEYAPASTEFTDREGTEIHLLHSTTTTTDTTGDSTGANGNQTLLLYILPVIGVTVLVIIIIILIMIMLHRKRRKNISNSLENTKTSTTQTTTLTSVILDVDAAQDGYDTLHSSGSAGTSQRPQIPEQTLYTTVVKKKDRKSTSKHENTYDIPDDNPTIVPNGEYQSIDLQPPSLNENEAPSYDVLQRSPNTRAVGYEGNEGISTLESGNEYSYPDGISGLNSNEEYQEVKLETVAKTENEVPSYDVLQRSEIVPAVENTYSYPDGISGDKSKDEYQAVKLQTHGKNDNEVPSYDVLQRSPNMPAVDNTNISEYATMGEQNSRFLNREGMRSIRVIDPATQKESIYADMSGNIDEEDEEYFDSDEFETDTDSDGSPTFTVGKRKSRKTTKRKKV